MARSKHHQNHPQQKHKPQVHATHAGSGKTSWAGAAFRMALIFGTMGVLIGWITGGTTGLLIGLLFGVAAGVGMGIAIDNASRKKNLKI